MTNAEKGKETRRLNEIARHEAHMKAEAEKQEILAGLRKIVNSDEPTTAEKLEAARLAVELHKRY